MIGTTISPGPCRYHCGSGVSVGVSTNVGDGETVGVSVGIKVCVAVTVSVCEGRGLKVCVGSMIAVATGGEIKVNPLQPMENKAARITGKLFFKSLQWMVQFPQNA